MHRGDAEHEHDDAVTRARRQHEQEEQRRHGEQDVHRAHQQRVDDRLRVAGEQSDRCADDVGERRRERRERDDAPAAPENAGEDVAPEPVRPERKAAAGPLQRQPDDRGRVVRREQGAEDDESEQQYRGREPHLAGAGAREAQPRGERRHFAVLSFGTSNTTSRSATTFSEM